MIHNDFFIDLTKCSDKERKQVKNILLKNYMTLLNDIEIDADYCTVDAYWKDFIPQSKPIVNGKDFISEYLDDLKKQYKFIAIIDDEIIKPKGFYYQGKHIILVGDVEKGHTIRRKELIDDVIIEIL